MRRTSLVRMASRTFHVADGVLLQILARMLGAKADVGIGGHVINEIRALHCSGERSDIQDIAATQTKMGFAERASRNWITPGGEVVEPDDVVPQGQKPVSEVAADEPGGACNKGGQWLNLLNPPASACRRNNWRAAAAIPINT